MPPITIPVVLAWGTPKHLRYVICDTSGRFWTGKTWSDRQRDAVLYASHSDAGYATQRILLKHFRRSPVFQQFVVPLEMQVYADAEIGPDELKDFAQKAVKLSALFANHGTGPRPDSLVLPRINWRKLTQPINSERDLHIDE
jgi:hypothetical protein